MTLGIRPLIRALKIKSGFSESCISIYDRAGLFNIRYAIKPERDDRLANLR